MKIKWKKINGWPYDVSSNGLLRRTKKANGTYVGRIVRPSFVKNGYGIVILQNCGKKKTTRIHRLVAEAFIGPCPDGLQVNHKDGNKRNNLASNLEYVDRVGNMQHAAKMGLLKGPGTRGTGHAGTKLTEQNVLDIRSYLAKGFTVKQAAAFFSIGESCVAHIKFRRTWRHI